MRLRSLSIGWVLALSTAEAFAGHQCINGQCGQPIPVDESGNGQKIVLTRGVASVPPEPVARGAQDKPLVLASAYANPAGTQDDGKKYTAMGLAYWAPKSTAPDAPKPAVLTGNAIFDTMANAGVATTGIILQGQGIAAERDLKDRAERSIKADGGFGAGQTVPAMAEAMVKARTQALQAYLGDPTLNPTGLDNARGLRTVDVGGGTKANVHSLPTGRTMELGGTKFTGGSAPPGSSKIGYFVPQELKPGTQVYTGDSGNKQATLAVGDKRYAMFFPPGTSDEQMRKGLATAKTALEGGMDPSKISAGFRETNSTTDPAAALKAMEGYAKRDGALREVDKLHAEAKAWEDRITADGLDEDPDAAAEKTNKLAELSKQLKDETLETGKVDAALKAAKDL